MSYCANLRATPRARIDTRFLFLFRFHSSVPASFKGTEKVREVHAKGTPRTAPSESAYRGPLEMCLNSTRSNMRALVGMTLPTEDSKMEKSAQELDVLCVDDRILLTEDAVASAGAGAGSSAGSMCHVVELVAHVRVGPPGRDSSVLGHMERMVEYLELTSEALEVDKTRMEGWIVNYELVDREEDKALLAAHKTGLHVLHVFHDGPTVTRVVYWGPDSADHEDLDLEEGE
jgi:hypothetical protein